MSSRARQLVSSRMRCWSAKTRERTVATSAGRRNREDDMQIARAAVLADRHLCAARTKRARATGAGLASGRQCRILRRRRRRWRERPHRARHPARADQGASGRLDDGAQQAGRGANHRHDRSVAQGRRRQRDRPCLGQLHQRHRPQRLGPSSSSHAAGQSCSTPINAISRRSIRRSKAWSTCATGSKPIPAR